jgi:hypothetical protein
VKHDKCVCERERVSLASKLKDDILVGYCSKLSCILHEYFLNFVRNVFQVPAVYIFVQFTKTLRNIGERSGHLCWFVSCCCLAVFWDVEYAWLKSYD